MDLFSEEVLYFNTLLTLSRQHVPIEKALCALHEEIRRNTSYFWDVYCDNNKDYSFELCQNYMLLEKKVDMMFGSGAGYKMMAENYNRISILNEN